MSYAKIRLEDYLTTIYRLEEALGIARIKELSSELGVSPATASKVIKKLEEKGLVTREKYHYIKLTDKGRGLAEAIIRKHRIAELFLSKILDFNDYEAHYYAHYFEHLPDTIIERIHRLLEYPSACPHGNPLPGTNYTEKGEFIRLSEASEGSKCTVKRLLGELRDVLKYIVSASIKVNTSLTILSKSSDSIQVSIENTKEVTIPTRIAYYILVKCE